MECERNDSDDEELEALRLAALATLKSHTANKLKSESSEASTRNTASPIITLPPRKEPGLGSLPSSQYSWRNSVPQLRRGGRGRGSFPKINQRSNLIVITPVSTDDVDVPETTPKPQLSLPQHKWCQAVNENSSSPKTFSRRGPTRFNRHESGSESSDSDYDEASDQDSYSNETILQDENSMNFAQLTPEESIENEAEERNTDHRLSFQNANLDSIQSVERVPPTNTTYSLGGIDDKIVSSSTLSDPINRVSTNYSSYPEYNPSPGTSYQSQIVSSVPVNGGLEIDRDYDGTCRGISEAATDGYSGGVVKNCSVDPNLSQNDLRIELKKRMLKLRSETGLAKSETQPGDKHVRDKRRISDDLGRGYSRNSSRIQNRSRSDGTGDSRVRNRSRSLTRNRLRSPSPRNSDRIRSRSRSLTRNRLRSPSPRNSDRIRSRSRSLTRNRLRSPSPRNPDRIRSRSRDRDHKRGERTSKRDCSHSPGRRHHRELTPSPDRNGKHSWSRSPVKTQKRTSASPVRNNKRNHSPQRSDKRNCSRSPQWKDKHHYSRSPERSSRRENSRSPGRSNKRHYSRSPKRSNRRENTRSPERINKRDNSCSPERGNKHYSSPDQSTNRDHGSDKSKKRNFSHSPHKSYKRTLSPSSKKGKSSHSPYKSHKQSPSPDRTSKHDIAPSISQKHSGTQSPVRNHKRNSISSLDKTHRKSSPHNLERKHKRNVSRSPHPSEKSRSPEKKPSRSKRDRSRSPLQSHRHDSSESVERNRSRTKSSRYRQSRSSSALSSSSGSVSSSGGRFRSVSSVIKPVQSCAVTVASSVDKRSSSSDSDFSSNLKKGKEPEDKPKALSSLVKSSIVVGENRNNAPDGSKRLPVHMRLGTLPRNKLIRMTKDVEAAFVNTSSDENVETVGDGKKQNFCVVAESDVSKRRVQKSPSKGDSKSQRKKTYR